MDTNLFGEFNPISQATWKQKIQVDLKGLDYNKTLLWKTKEDITVKPFYTKEDRSNKKVNVSKKGFSICQKIFIDDEKIANNLAKDAILRGANSIWFEARNKFDYETALTSLITKKNNIFIQLDFLDVKFIKELNTYTLKNKNIRIFIDPIGKFARTGNWYSNYEKDFEQLEFIKKLENIFIGVDASLYQNAGATINQQLAYSLSHFNEYLENLGAEIIKKVIFLFSNGSNYFFEISKLRAFRNLHEILLKEYKKTNKATVIAFPSLRNKTIYDYNVNMLRTTSESMSAILGGADFVSNLSYDAVFNKSNEFGERIARNQLIILQKEAYLENAQHIADGSYYIDVITHNLSEKALQIFKLIEKNGGFIKQLLNGVVQKKIKEQSDKELKDFNDQKLLLLGTNRLPNNKEKLKATLEIYPFQKKKHIKTQITPILTSRISELYEKDRLKS